MPDTMFEEPQEAFPYLPPSAELRNQYSHLFRIEMPLPSRLDKKILDKTAAIVILLCSTPILLTIWIAYKIEGFFDPSSKGPVFYFYWSVSAGRKIKKLKIRSVKMEFIDPALFAKNDWRACKGEWSRAQRTRVGHFVKCYYLDELPQFWSVLKGDMSIVGPRPLAVHHYERDLHQGNVARKLLTGGILGLGHIRKGTNEMGDPRFEYEYIDEYLKRPPFGILSLDIWIIWQGLKVVLAGKGL